jgi:hypothetical protein
MVPLQHASPAAPVPFSRAVAGVCAYRTECVDSGAPLGLALPFLIAGAVKSVYDLALWRLFRPVQLVPEPATPTGGTT